MNRTKNARKYLAVATLVLMILGCSNSTTTQRSSTSETAKPVPTATIAVVTFATRMAADLRGTFTYEDGCMQVDSGSPTGVRLLVWLLDQYTIEVKSDRLTYIDHLMDDRTGEWMFGSKIMSGGGETGPSSIAKLPHQPIPDHCTGKLWLIGEAT